jgi:lysozyme
MEVQKKISGNAAASGKGSRGKSSKDATGTYKPMGRQGALKRQEQKGWKKEQTVQERKAQEVKRQEQMRRKGNRKRQELKGQELNRQERKGRKGELKRRRNGGRKRQRKVKVPAWAAVTTAALLLALAVGLPQLRHARPGGETGAALPPISFNELGIDISHHNEGPIQWDSLRVMVDRSGRTVKDLEKARRVYPVKFVFIKATEGLSLRDPKFKSYWTEAGERDMRRGAYHFFRSSRDGAAQARHFIATVGQLRHDDLPPVLDIETIHRGCTYKLLNERALQWLKEVEKHYGRKPIVYTTDSFARDILCDEIKDNYPIWIAHYGVDSPEHDDWTYWQFTDRALVYGLPAPADLSIRK